MNKKFVYLAGPISGCDFDEATYWRDAVSRKFLPGIVGVSPMRVKEWCENLGVIEGTDQYQAHTTDAEYLISGESHAIRARDFNDVKNADMVLMYAPQDVIQRVGHSVGTLIELGWASAQGVPVVLVTDHPMMLHPLVRESAGWIVPTLELGVEAVNSVLSAYVED